MKSKILSLIFIIFLVFSFASCVKKITLTYVNITFPIKMEVILDADYKVTSFSLNDNYTKLYLNEFKVLNLNIASLFTDLLKELYSCGVILNENDIFEKVDFNIEIVSTDTDSREIVFMKIVNIFDNSNLNFNFKCQKNGDLSKLKNDYYLNSLDDFEFLSQYQEILNLKNSFVLFEAYQLYYQLNYYYLNYLYNVQIKNNNLEEFYNLFIDKNFEKAFDLLKITTAISNCFQKMLSINKTKNEILVNDYKDKETATLMQRLENEQNQYQELLEIYNNCFNYDLDELYILIEETDLNDYYNEIDKNDEFILETFFKFHDDNYYEKFSKIFKDIKKELIEKIKSSRVL